MSWTVTYLPEVRKDLRDIDGSPRKQVRKAIEKVRQNPLPTTEGGFGKPLGNKGGNDLTGFLKIKLRSEGIRIMYKVVRQDDEMLVIVIGARADEEVYDIARQRIIKYNL
ncbi:MAG: type II toxin-antitoxin system RelE/ParE family toxin [Oscillospiraceae bacterium]|nr:type II toxin-antitoxin system RelE/ParE family toxin [Oscillospiraceae bacterium]